MKYASGEVDKIPEGKAPITANFAPPPSEADGSQSQDADRAEPSEDDKRE